MRGTQSRIYLWVSFLFLITSCKNRLHVHYDATQVNKDVYATLTNDSIGLWLKSAADIDYRTNEAEARRFLKKEWELIKPENIVVIGKTTVEPHYSFIITMDTPSRLDHSNFSGIRIHTFERLVNGKRINLIAHGEKPNLRPDDFLFILDNMKFE